MTTLDLSTIAIGDLLIRRSALVDIPVVISEMDEGTFMVGLRPEEIQHNVEMMTQGMMLMKVEGSPVAMIKGVGWKYSRLTGDEIDPNPKLGGSILLKE